MNDYTDETADLLLEVMPAAMRKLAAEMRNRRGNLDPSHFRLLAKLHHDTHSLGELAQTAAVSPATISRSIATLEERGWVERSSSPKDGRVVLVCLTEQGRSVLESVSMLAKDWILEQLDSLSPEDQKTLYEGIVVLHRAIGQGLETMASSTQSDSQAN